MTQGVQLSSQKCGSNIDNMKQESNSHQSYQMEVIENLHNITHWLVISTQLQMPLIFIST